MNDVRMRFVQHPLPHRTARNSSSARSQAHQIQDRHTGHWCPFACCGGSFDNSAKINHIPTIQVSSCDIMVDIPFTSEHLKQCNNTFQTKPDASSQTDPVIVESISIPFVGSDSDLKKLHPLQQIRRSLEKPKGECQNCGGKFGYYSMDQHVERCNNNGLRLFKCSEAGCNKSFRTFREKSNHVRYVHTEPVTCPIDNCHTVIKRKNLSQHVRQVHNKIRAECSNCEKKISYRNLNAHMKICTSDGSRMFACTEWNCEKTFKTAAQRAHHVYTVHTEPIDCPLPGCDARIKKSYLSQHVRKVHDRCKEKCHNCGKEMLYGNLRSHIKKCHKG